MSTRKKQKSARFGSRQPLDSRLRSGMIQWLEFKLSHLEAALKQMKTANRASRLTYLENNVTYYKNAVSVTKWLIAQMRAKVPIEDPSPEDLTDESSVDATSRQ